MVLFRFETGHAKIQIYTVKSVIENGIYFRFVAGNECMTLLISRVPLSLPAPRDKGRPLVFAPVKNGQSTLKNEHFINRPLKMATTTGP